MELEKYEAIVEAMLFSTGSIITDKDIMRILEIGNDKIEEIISRLKLKYEKESSGIELIKVDDRISTLYKKRII